jgi:hypothetical protein
MRQRGRDVAIEIEGESKLPPGGIVLREPGAGWSAGRTTVNGQPARWSGGELHVKALPARITIEPKPTSRPTNKKTP